MDQLIINSHVGSHGVTTGCIYTGKGAETPDVCYTYEFANGRCGMIVWVGMDIVAEHHTRGPSRIA